MVSCKDILYIRKPIIKFLKMEEPRHQYISMDNDQSILENPYTMPRSNLQFSYYKSVVEQDLRLRMIRNTQPPFDDCEDICKLDRKVAKEREVHSHPIAVYLNKLASKSKIPASANQDRISDQMASLLANKIKKSLSGNDKLNHDNFKNTFIDQTRRKLDGMYIDLRKRWNKLYDRNPPFKLHIQETLSAEISNKSAQLKYVLSSKEPAKCWNAERFRRKRERVHRILIYRRCKMELQNAQPCFPLIWKEPVSSEVIDEVSGDALCHITLLCRDVICEANKCTTGCPTAKFSCDACRMRTYTQRSKDALFSVVTGSFAEGCTLPIFYVDSAESVATKIWSDIDGMYPTGNNVGFEETESDIIAIICTERTPPGYLQLRQIGTEELYCALEERQKSEYIGPNTENNSINFARYWDITPHGPAKQFKHFNVKPHVSIPHFDSVPFHSCSSWPAVAKPWIDRERPCNWPSKETIQSIVSKGCRIVHTPHVLCQGQETVFRFSFSEAETILFRTLTSDQKKCFVAFKSLLKYGIEKLKNKKDENNLSSYCLKTIFLWACETISADHWQTTNGWSRCLLYMIDQLHSCVKTGKLPGYFIPETNLLDTMKGPSMLLNEIEELRSIPLLYASAFIHATKCFRGFHSKISVADETNILCISAQNANVLIDQLKFLHGIVAKSKATRSGLFWRKETVLRIFANWCKQNSCALGLELWQCLTGEMTLFDIVYLDIVHGFDIPIAVLLEYLDKGWSADFVCKLGICFSYYRFDRENHRSEVKYSFLFKTLHMIQHALDQEIVSVKLLFTCVSILMKLEEFEIAARVLESGTDEFLRSYESLSFDYVFASVVSNKLRNNLRELTDLREREHETGLFKVSVPVFFWYSLYVCYKNLGHGEKLQGVLTQMNYYSKLTLSRNLFSDMDYLDIHLFLEMYANIQEWRMYHYEYYDIFISLEMLLIKLQSKYIKILGFDGQNDYSNPQIGLFCSCNDSISDALQSFLVPCDPIKNPYYDDIAESLFRRQMVTTADRVHYAQVLIAGNKIEQAIPNLNAIVEEEGDYSLSVVIWPKLILKSYLLDVNLRKELKNHSADYIVFPSNLYARYLLVNAYNSLGQTEQCERNRKEFLKLLEWYSTFTAFAPMSNIMFNIFKKK